MTREEFYKNLCLAHSAKGTTWSKNNTKYKTRIKTANGYKYVYEDGESTGTLEGQRQAMNDRYSMQTSNDSSDPEITNQKKAMSDRYSMTPNGSGTNSSSLVDSPSAQSKQIAKSGKDSNGLTVNESRDKGRQIGRAYAALSNYKNGTLNTTSDSENQRVRKANELVKKYSAPSNVVGSFATEAIENAKRKANSLARTEMLNAGRTDIVGNGKKGKGATSGLKKATTSISKSTRETLNKGKNWITGFFKKKKG